jgi:ferric-chelate reductase (NADPH)
MRSARVSAVTTLSAHFRFIDFEAEALKNCAWAPGQKIQIKLDGGLATRTYTPIHWDRARGATRMRSTRRSANTFSELPCCS